MAEAISFLTMALFGAFVIAPFWPMFIAMGVVGRIYKARMKKVRHDGDAVLQVGEVEEKA